MAGLPPGEIEQPKGLKNGRSGRRVGLAVASYYIEVRRPA
jgi:hypothetical protein